MGLSWLACAALTLSLAPRPQLAHGQSPPLQPIPATESPQEIGQQIMHRALHEAVWGSPALCDIRQTIQLYQHRTTGFGKYVRGGQGGGKLRMSLQLPAGDQMNTLLVVSDGELLYSHERIGDISQRTRVDLDKVRNRLVITTDSLTVCPPSCCTVR